MIHDREVVGSNPGAVYWVELTFFTLTCCKNCIDVCLKRPKISEIVAGWAHSKNIYHELCDQIGRFFGL